MRFGGRTQGGGGFGNDILVAPASGDELTLQVFHDQRAGRADGIHLVWNGDGQLEITSPSGERHHAPAEGLRLSPEEFADASCARIRIDLLGPRDEPSVEYRIRILSGTTFSLAAFVVSDGVPVGGPNALGHVLTINGGVSGDFAPTLTGVRQRRGAEGVDVTLSGMMLRRVSDLRLLGRGMQVITPAWSSVGVDSLHFHVSNSVAMQARFVQVRDSAGRGSVEPCDLRGSVHPPVKNQILAQLRDGYSAESLREISGAADVAPAVRWTDRPAQRGRTVTAETYPDFALVDLSVDATVPEVLARLRAHPGVKTADSLSEGELSSTPNDPRWPYQWTLHPNAPRFCTDVPEPAGGGSINANLAWDYPAAGPPVAIGIIDSGIHGDHQDFIGQLAGLPHMRSTLIPGFDVDFDPSPLIDSGGFQQGTGHGTPVAGIAAGGTGFDEPYIPGYSTASVSRYGLPVSLKCAFTNGLTVPTVVQALEAVTAEAGFIRIANMSLGFDTLSPTERILLASALRQAFLGGALLVASVGNDFIQGVKYPAAMADLVVAVGAVDWHNNRWHNESTLQGACPNIPFPSWGSNWGPWLDLMAPGGVAVQAPSGGVIGGPFGTTTDNASLPLAQPCVFCSGFPAPRLSGFQGTSAAAPVVSGAAAWLLHVMPDLTAEDAGEVLRRTATDLPPTGFDIFHGHGSIDLEVATKFLHRPGTPILKVLHHDELGTQNGLVVVDSAQVSISLTNSPVAAQNNSGQPQSAIRYRLSGTATYPAFSVTPALWVRRASTLGVDDGASWDHLERTPWARSVGNVGTGSAELETFVYRLTALDPATQDVFYPCPPSLARVAFTALGEDTPLQVSGAESPSSPLHIDLRSSNPGSRLVFVVRGGAGGPLKASIFDLQGRRVADPLIGDPNADTPTVSWLGDDSSGIRAKAGMYLLRVERAGRVVSRRFLLIR